MSINLETVQATAKLAYIELNNDIEIMHNKLLSILKAVELLHQVDTKGVPPFKHEHFSQPNMREDIVDCNSTQKELEKLASKFNNDAYQIPIVLNNTGK
jgi:aspartyl/glutamyl-tRNA(Asn/Gln) amidotransferase C subunit